MKLEHYRYWLLAVMAVLAVCVNIYLPIISKRAKANQSALQENPAAKDSPAPLKESEEISVKVFSIVPKDYNKTFEVYDAFHFNLEVHNNGSRKIEGIKGTLKIYDAFGDLIASFRCKFEENIGPGNSFRQIIEWKPNIFDKSAQRLAETKKFSTEFVVEQILEQ